MSNRTLDALRRLLTGGFALLRTRVEYATLELSLARERILRWCVRGLVAVLLLQLALASSAALVVALLWPFAGPWSLLVFVMLFGGIAWWMLRRLVHEIERAPSPLAETLRQLGEDQRVMAEAFGGASPRESAERTAESPSPAAGSHAAPDPPFPGVRR